MVGAIIAMTKARAIAEELMKSFMLFRAMYVEGLCFNRREVVCCEVSMTAAPKGGAFMPFRSDSNLVLDRRCEYHCCPEA